MEQLALSSIQNVYGPEKDVVTHSHEDISIENKAKLELLNNFVDEQRGYFWKLTQAGPGYGTTGSSVAFAEDSDDGIVHQDVHFSPAEPAATRKGGRPQIQRRGDSWMKRVNDYLDKQPADQLGKAPWLSRVHTFLETPFIEGGITDRNRVDGPIGSPIQLPLCAQEPVVFVSPHCLHTNPPPRNKDFIGRDSDLAKLLIATEFIVSADDATYEQGRLVTLGRDFLEQTDLRWL
ncbi:MAG: hypothetical protein LQ343_006364 [Gyalolechia ehrenbergii]|nr:MAG: hypothetical protein LQ343_006364 [Gyalolechia ehrenbergii]